MAEAVRVALLARAGDARQQLRQALADLGADLVAEGDPNELDPQTVSGQSPKLVLVSLEPAIELGLERFDDLLSASNVEVIYDDAEVTSALSGWDLNRWARHLAAKMMGHDLLPPMPADAEGLDAQDLQPIPGAVPTPAQLMSEEKLEDYTRDTHEMALFVPAGEALPEAVVSEGGASDAALQDLSRSLHENVADDVGVEAFQFDIADVEQAMRRMEFAQQEQVIDKPSSAPSASYDGIVDEISITADDEAMIALDEGLLADLGDADLSIDGDFGMQASDAAPSTDIRFSGFDAGDGSGYDGNLDSDIAELAAQLEDFQKNDTRQAAQDMQFSADVTSPAVSEPLRIDQPKLEAAVPSAPAKGKLDFSSLSLADEDAALPAAAPQAKSETRLREFDFSKLSLEAIEEEAPGAGQAVASAPSSGSWWMVMAGLGGPDAVRQALSHLDPNSQAVVLVQQHLEVGSYDRLATQFAKVAKLPVSLAVEGGAITGGRCYVMPEGLALDVARRCFIAGDVADILTALPSAGSRILVASGTEARWLSALQAFQRRGGELQVQDPAECFEPGTAQALRDAGISTCTPRDWPSR